MNKICLISIAVGVLAVTGGCTSLVSVAPSTVPITAHDTYTKLGRTAGTSQSVVVLGFLSFGSSSPSRSARDEAMEAKRANALIEVTESFRLLNLLIIQYRWTTVEGTAIQFEQGGKEL